MVLSSGLLLGDRIDNARRTLRREVGIFRDVVEDVKERADLDQQVEPRNTRGAPPFETGSLIKEPIVVGQRTADNVVQHIHEMAKINRRRFR